MFPTEKTLPILASAAVLILLGTAVWFIDRSEIQRHRQEAIAQTVQQLSTIRARAESSVNKRLYLTLGLKAHVASNPDSSSEEFALFASSLMQEGRGIRSITLIKDNVINDVFPREGNEGAIGLKLLEHPQQRADVLNAIDQRKPLLSGPIKLVQGGEAFVNRAPVFITADSNHPGAGRYWGLVSILIDKDTLLNEITRDAPEELSFAVREERDADHEFVYLVGGPEIQSQSPLVLKVTLPTGVWQVVGAPKDGWPSQAPTSLPVRIGGSIFAILAAALVYLVLVATLQFRAAREAAIEASKAKSEFLANMSHEIRTPMTAILGFAEVLEQSARDEETRHAVRTIRTNGDHLLTIINDILDVSKIEAGKLTVERVECSPVELIREVASLIEVRAEAKGLRLQVQFVGKVPASIETDPTRLKQVLINLLGNAIKFTKEGTVSLRASLINIKAKQPQLHFTVSDTGIGIQADQIETLFDVFTQADASTTRRFGGTGLGLAISKKLVGMLGGKIEVQSKLGVGTTFSFAVDTGSLHAVEMVEPELTPGAAVAKEAAATSNGKPLLNVRVLLADDSEVNQQLLRIMLEQVGVDLTVVDNGREAVEAALHNDRPFDVVLMDMLMPVLDGYEATAELRRRGYARPIIALTANAMSDEEAKCLAAGASAYASKPISRDKLVEVISSVNSAETV